MRRLAIAINYYEAPGLRRCTARGAGRGGLTLCVVHVGQPQTVVLILEELLP